MTSHRDGSGLVVPMICTSSVGVATGMMWPLLSLRLDQMGFGSGSIGLSASVQSAATLAILPFAPALLSRWGIIRLLAASMFGIVTCLLLFPAFPGFGAWLGIRVAFGAAVSIVSIAAPLWIAAVARSSNRGRAIGAFGLLWSAGFTAGPSILWATRDFRWLPFTAAAAIVSAAALSLAVVRGAVPVAVKGGAAQWSSVLRSVPRPALTAALVLGLLDAATDSFLPLYGLRKGLDEGHAVSMLIILQTGVTAAQLPVGWLVDRTESTQLMFLLAGGALIAAIFLPFGASESRWLFADLALLGFAIGGVWTTSVMLLAEQFSECERAIANTMRTFLYGLGGILFSPLVGLGIDVFGANVLPVSAAGALFLLGVSCSRVRVPHRVDQGGHEHR